ncbi:flavin reductase family protein [Gordonia sp. LSe1-13]|uniref:Flavin reductase family protein n=1 Tax=Gordonia sesuvii TaxID=3116777 RepID=A0ABU7MJT8_9ACTN|nr:flavin reductase family protein [Gordonia sp. LSe1-13]
MTAPKSDGAVLRRVFANVPAGVIAICADTGTERIGMAASTFVPVSLDPPLVAFCVQNTSTTWPRLAARDRLGISVLSSTQDTAARALAAKSGDRFSGIDTETHEDGALFVRGCPVWLDVSVDRQVPAGDHAIVVMAVHDHFVHDTDTDVDPIVFHRSEFRRLAS